MGILLTGLAVFILIHLLPTSPKIRDALIAKLGYPIYLALFSLISIVGFILIVYGFSEAPRKPLYQPLANARNLAEVVMPLVFILILAAYLKTHIRTQLKHPMLIGTLLWALVHLSANGDSAAVALFGGFLLYAVADMILAKPRQNLIPAGTPSVPHDIIAVAGGVIVYLLAINYHQYLSGVALG